VSATAANAADIARQVKKLASERGALFDKAGTTFGLSDADQARLRAVEQELDECFLARRQQRAVRDAVRFDNDERLIRRPTPPAPR
jgi:hypothetical protein